MRLHLAELSEWAEPVQAASCQDGHQSHGDTDWTGRTGDVWAAGEVPLLNVRHYRHASADCYYKHVVGLLVV